MKDSGKAEYGMLTYIAGKLTKTDGQAPQSEAVKRFFAKVDADDDWFPGKADYEKTGAPAALTGPNRAAIARSAMALKKRGGVTDLREGRSIVPQSSSESGDEAALRQVHNLFRSR